ncbi:L,D-transpeptidase [Pseudahrensia aquimaris]|uniref:L,D-transpeptidase n=1 Tax=Pseudahrensia aquimaris TaxID=744461 RepID=A0ABW3FGY2_9HYPH
MKKIVVLMAFVMSLFTVSAFADQGAKQTVPSVSKGYVKKDKAYWTRVWYKNNGYKKRNGRWVKAGVKSRSKRSTRKRISKNSYRPSRSSGIVARVDLSKQRMYVYDRGVLRHTWKVSTGRKGYGTPTGTWKIHRMHKEYYSKKYDNAPMPYAMFYYRGFAIHGTGSISRLGRPASHGCVRLHPKNAAKLFSMVRRKGGTVKVTW